MAEQTLPPSLKKPFWRRGLAGFFDFLTILFVGGYLIGSVAGERTSDGGFHLTGMAALVLFAVVILYFYLGWKVVGGTLWQRIFAAR